MSEIHIIGDEGDVQVWLDTEIAECDGLVIGVGATQLDAIDSALEDLRGSIAKLLSMREAEVAAAIDAQTDALNAELKAAARKLEDDDAVPE